MSQPPRRSSGTHQGLREPLHWPEGKPFRILSIDGGGIRGILPAEMLSLIERRYLDGRCVGDYFDLITGTSTGGIIGLGLSIGKTAKAILDLYKIHGPCIFPPARFNIFNVRKVWRLIQGAQHHRYDSAKLEEPLRDIFGSSKIGDASRRLCIPSFDGFTEVNVFKTPHHRDYKMDWKEDMVTVAMATAAAPTYFPVYKNGERMFADGGVWANNPVMIGLVDALVCHQIQRRQVHILSLGTGDTEIRFSEGQILHGGLWDWAEIISSAMHLQSQNATGQAGLLIGRDQLIRLNAPPPAGQKPIDLDDCARACAELPGIAKKLIDENGDAIRDRFLFAPAEPYPAFYGSRAPSS
ncbi:CBASS cGAMP-activated phospholipase [Rhodopseudomonas palustris]|uniref:CBASS cGAMP-activated phospholipase n=1 Tax=Rhodopseudomonas palustris TaxID=1076 RepID=UPI002ACE7574|nr:CBASS cGAMP-activated phospholipase [Rhodopseudomonas palustris]WQH00893.1 CBASS cGAMP-activated phospholipase [Rhodopseudomonas palustris]